MTKSSTTHKETRMRGKEELEAFEANLEVDARNAAKILGVAYTTYLEYKNDRRATEKRRLAPQVLLFSAEALQLLPEAIRESIVNFRLDEEVEAEKSMNSKLIKQFEEHIQSKLGLPDRGLIESAHKLLGRKYNTYNEYKNEKQALPLYVKNSIITHMYLEDATLVELMAERTDRLVDAA